MRRVDADSIAAAPLWAAHPTASAVEINVDKAAEDKARREADYKAALDSGFRKGQAEGLAKAQEAVRAQAAARQKEHEAELGRAQAQCEQARRSFETLAGNLKMLISAESRRAEELAVEVAFSAVARLIGKAYADGTLIADLVRHAMLEVDAEVDAVLVSGQDAALLGEVEGVSIVVDGRLLPGQCRLQTRLGSYDTGLDVRLDMLRTALLSGLSEHRAMEGLA